jgi:Holliday junction resolvase
MSLLNGVGGGGGGVTETKEKKNKKIYINQKKIKKLYNLF